MDRENIAAIAGKELRESLRNRWFLFFTVAFAGLALALSLLSAPRGAQLALTGFGRTAAGLVNLVLLFVPLIGLTLGASNLAGERETGALTYLLSQPVTRAEVLLGKYLGLAGALLASLALGFGVAGVALALQKQGAGAEGYLLSVLLAFLLGLGMLSLGFLISVVVHRTATALGGALFAWLFLVFAGDLGVMGTAIVTRMPIETTLALAVLNPLQLFKMASILVLQTSLEVLGPAGMYATERAGVALLPLLIGGLLLWAAIPLGLALVQFGRPERSLLSWRAR